MNKFFAVILAISLLCSTILPAFGSDYEGHWAEDIANELVSAGIISGDANGLRLNDSIKRCEFVKVINNAFELEEKAMDNFPDVSFDKWYFNEFLKAKKAGYLTGDNLGNANPEANIRRVEAAVILSRLLGYNSSNTIGNFKDHNNIPEWGRDAVYTLASHKIINGYADGSFKAEGILTRAEAFALISRASAPSTNEDKNENTSSAVKEVSGIVNSGGGGGSSGGGGGSSGGGGSAGGSSLPVLNISQINEKNNSIVWDRVNGVPEYTILVKRLSNGAVASDVTTTNEYTKLSELLATVAPISERSAEEKVEIIIMAVYNGNTLSAATNMTISYPYVKSPEIKVVSEDVSGSEKLYFVWEKDENADTYTLTADFDNSGFVSVGYTVSDNMCKAEIPENVYDKMLKSISYKISATSIDAEKVIPLKEEQKVTENCLYAGGSGKSHDPYLIKNARHFRNIAENPDAYYNILRDIILNQSISEGGYTPIEAFSGALIGVSEDGSAEEIRTITVYAKEIGLFKSISNASFKNLRISGYVKDGEKTMYISPFAGVNTGSSTFADCENSAYVNASVSAQGGVGGLLAFNDGTVTFENCKNTADITCSGSDASTFTGGICGKNTGESAKKPTFVNCGNTGKIVSDSSAAAGILGGSKIAELIGCFNIGDISSQQSAGGLIASYTSSGTNYTVNTSYNTGNISASYAGGIAGNINGSVSIYDSYNNGEIIDSANPGKMISKAVSADLQRCYDGTAKDYEFATATTLSCSDCYCLFEETVISSDNSLSKLCETDMRNKDSFSGFDFANIWEINQDYAYKYPRLISNPYIFVLRKLDSPDISIISTRVSSTLKIEGNSNVVSYVITINGNEFTIDGGGEKEIDITSYITSVGNYQITVKAVGDGVQYADSDIATESFEKEQFRFMPTVTGVAGNENDEYTVSWSVNEVEGLGGYLISATDKLDGTDILTDERVSSDTTSFVISPAELYSFEPGREYIVKVKAIGLDESESSEYVSYEFSTLYAGGKGTESSPYILRNGRHFSNISANKNSVYYIANDMEADQTLSENAYTPISGFTGKLIGMSDDLSCEEIRTITVTSDSGVGLFASVSGGLVKNIRLTGEISGYTLNSGGIVGEASGGATFENCENSATFNVTVPSGVNIYAGGIVGTHSSGAITITNCKNTASITTEGGNNVRVGGIVGINNISGKLTLNRCSNTGDISGKYGGGLIGSLKTGDIDRCFNSGNITCVQIAAGIIGSSNGTNVKNIRNTYNSGSVQGGTYAGGIIGNAASSSVSNCYNAGTISNIANSGQICGKTDAGCSIINCYYLSDATEAEVNGITALSETDMQNKDNFADFDFESIWNQPDSGVSYKYPTLK